MGSERILLDAGGVSVTAALHVGSPVGGTPVDGAAHPRAPHAGMADTTGPTFDSACGNEAGVGGSTSDSARGNEAGVRGSVFDAPDGGSAQEGRPATTAGTSPATLLAHGAGGDLDGAGLVALAETIAPVAGPVVRANLPYREAGRRLPPRAEASVDAFQAIRVSAAELLGVGDWVVGGKSYGGRVASLAVASGMPAVGLVFYGYPLHPPGRPERLRVDHWPKIAVPCLFLQGDRDPHCDLGLLEAHLDHLGGRAELHVVEGADHSLRISRAASPEGVAVGEDQVISALGPVVGTWYAGVRAAAD